MPTAVEYTVPFAPPMPTKGTRIANSNPQNVLTDSLDKASPKLLDKASPGLVDKSTPGYDAGSSGPATSRAGLYDTAGDDTLRGPVQSGQGRVDLRA